MPLALYTLCFFQNAVINFMELVYRLIGSEPPVLVVPVEYVRLTIVESQAEYGKLVSADRIAGKKCLHFPKQS